MPLAPARLILLATCLAAAPAAAGSSLGAPPGLFDSLAAPDAKARPAGDAVASFPVLAWPMEHALNAGIALGNYVDDDTTTGVVHDYMGLDAAGDGHTGTDFGLLSFRAMDRGEEVRAAAGGTVAWKQDGKFDRSVGPPWPDDGNYVGIDHGDGSVAWYLHLREYSLTVDVGETVVAGQLLGFAGSSGYAWGPHLHFEVGQYAPNWIVRDPWHGTYNTLPSLWASQAPYVGDVPAIVHDLGIMTAAEAGGSFGSVTYSQLLEGFVPSVVFGTGESQLAMWILFQGNPGGSFRMEVRRPNGTLYWWVDFPIGFQAFPQTGIFPFAWSGSVGPADYGTWTAQALVGGNPVVVKTFVVGATTRYAPRFRPDGRSYRISGAVQRDTLRVDALGGPATFSLLGAPGFVTIESDSVLRVGATSTQPRRSLFFQVIATNATADKDTMWCHVVDPSKPQQGPVDAPLVTNGPATPLTLEPCVPNPFRASTTIRYALPSSSPAVVTIVDVAGRTLRRLADAGSTARGPRSLIWDGRDEAGVPLPAGVYFIRLESAGAQAASKVLRVK